MDNQNVLDAHPWIMPLSIMSSVALMQNPKQQLIIMLTLYELLNITQNNVSDVTVIENAELTVRILMYRQIIDEFIIDGKLKLLNVPARAKNGAWCNRLILLSRTRLWEQSFLASC